MNGPEASRLFLAGRITEAEHIKAWDAHGKRQQRAENPPPPRERKKDRKPPPTPNHRYAMLAYAVYADARLGPTEHRMLAYIVQMTRGRPQVELFVEQIADALLCSPRSVQRAQRLAEKHGFLRVEHVRHGRLNSANVYHLLEAVRPKPQAHPHRPSASPARYRVTTMTPHEADSKNSPPYPPSQARGGEEMRAASRGASAPVNFRRGGSKACQVLRLERAAHQDQGDAKIEHDPRQLDIEDAIKAKSTGPP